MAVLYRRGSNDGTYRAKMKRRVAGNGGNRYLVAGQPSEFDLAHVVFTASPLGEDTLYVNGSVEATRTHEAPDLSEWQSGARLTLANGMQGRCPWLGAFYLVAVYDRPLTAEQIATHHAAGPPRAVAARARFTQR